MLIAVIIFTVLTSNFNKVATVKILVMVNKQVTALVETRCARLYIYPLSNLFPKQSQAQFIQIGLSLLNRQTRLRPDCLA
jgi:hypothetical protein